jgi:hypothetical protein
MLFRALFWIAVVSLFMPHEPDLGLGRPNANASVFQSVNGWVSERAVQSKSDCKDDPAQCGARWSFLDAFQSIAVRNLAQVKADIEEQERGRRESDAR